MILSRMVRLQLVFFSLATLVGAGIIGVYFLRLPEQLGWDRYEVSAAFEQGAQLYEGAEVNYRGASVGSVTGMEIAERGITVTMRLESRFDIPADSVAEIHSRSAVGEQYVDLVPPPDTDTTTLLAAGATIPVEQTTTPVQTGPLIDNLGRLVDSIPTDDLNALLAETGTALEGRAPELQSLIDSTSSFVGTAEDNLGETRQLLRDFVPVSEAVTDTSGNVEAWTGQLASVTATLREGDADLRALLENTPRSSEQLRALLDQLAPVLPVTLEQLDIVAEIGAVYTGGIAQVLTDYPRLVEVVGSITSPFKDTQKVPLDLANLNDPPSCLRGFLPTDQQKAAEDTSVGPVPEVYCQEPDNSPRVVKGARNILCERYPGSGLRAATPAICDQKAAIRGLTPLTR